MAVREGAQASAADLHKLWIKMENERHQLAIEIGEARTGGADTGLSLAAAGTNHQPG